MSAARHPLQTLRLLLALAVLFPCIAPDPVWSQSNYEREIRDHQTQLEALKAEAKAKRDQARQFAREEKGVMEGLKQAEEALAATQRYIRKLDEGMALVRGQIERAVTDLSWAQDELVTRRAELRRRLRYSYVHKKVHALEVIFSADSFPNLLQRGAFLNRVFQEDRRLIGNVSKREAEVRQRLNRLNRHRGELKVLQAEKDEEKKQYQALKQDRTRALTRVTSQKKAFEKTARELEEAAEQLEGVLSELERKRKESLRRRNPVLIELDRNDFGNNRGRLPWPVDGEVVTKFGRQKHPKYGTEIISNGVDIAARTGTPVRSVGDGVVDLVKWLPGYGETVIINHGLGYYTIYGHLSSHSVGVGDRVEPGQLLGTVGNTASLKGPILHFEVRQGGSAQNPMIWLR